MMRPTRIIRYIGEVLLAIFALCTVPFLPRAFVLFLAGRLGGVAYLCSRKLRRIAFANLTLAFGESYTRAEKAAIVRESFVNAALVGLDLFWFILRPKTRIERHFTFDPSFVAYFRNQPVISVAAHFGNWEIMGKAAALAGHSSLSVAAPLDNPGINWVLAGIRTATGQRIVERYGALKSIAQELRAGGRIALLLDQNTLPSEGGEFVNFFGVPVPVSRAVAVLSSRLKVPVVPVFCAPTGRGHYKAYAMRAINADEPCQEGNLTQTIMTLLEEEIRRRPGCWLWMYKRWKYIAPGTNRNQYPFYARLMTPQEEHPKQAIDGA